MGLLDQLLAEKERRGLSAPEEANAKTMRRDTSTAMGGGAELEEPQSIPSIVKGRFNTGVWKNVVGATGYGAQAAGVSLQHPKRELTVQEYQNRMTPFTALDHATESAHNIADAEKSGSPVEMISTHKQVIDPEVKQQGDDLLMKGHSDSDIPEFYSGPTSTITNKPLSLADGTRNRAYVDINEQNLSPLEKNALVAKKYIGRQMVGGGEAVAEFADKVIKNNPEWELPSHLQGRGVLETLKADDVSFRDKTAMFIGGVAEQTPQIMSTIGLTLAGGLFGGPGGAMAGGAVGLGQNFMLETGGVYEELKSAHPNIREDELANIALTHGMVSTALELAPVANLISDIPGVKKALKSAAIRELIRKPKLTKRMAQSMATQGMTEGVTEGMQEVSANAAKGVYEENPEYFSGIDESVFMGFVMGALTGGLGAIGTHRSAIKKHNDERLHKLSSDQLASLANDPQTLSQEGVSQEEVLVAMEQVRVAEGLKSIQERMETSGLSLEELAATESEQAARFFARARNPERSANLARIRDANLTDENLQLLLSDPKSLDAKGLQPEDISSLVSEREDEAISAKHFEEILAKAPNDEVRQGIMDTLRGQYFQSIRDITESRGNATIKEVVEKGEAVDAKAKPKAGTKSKEKSKESGKDTKANKTSTSKVTSENKDKDVETTASEIADTVTEEAEKTPVDKYTAADKVELNDFQKSTMKEQIANLPETAEELKAALKKNRKTSETWEKQVDDPESPEQEAMALGALKSLREVKKAADKKLAKLSGKPVELFTSKSKIAADNVQAALKQSNADYKTIRAMGNTPEAKQEWGRYSALRRKINTELKAQGKEPLPPLKSWKEHVDSITIPGKVTKAEVQSKVTEILGGIPDFVNIDSKIPTKVNNALNQRGSVALKSEKPFSAPKWSSRLETDFIDKVNYTQSGQWLEALESWTKDEYKMVAGAPELDAAGNKIMIDKEIKGKKGPQIIKVPKLGPATIALDKEGKKIVKNAGMPAPVQEELNFSGLREWLESEENVTKEDIKNYLQIFNKLRTKEKTQGYSHASKAFAKALNASTEKERSRQNENKRDILDIFNKYNGDNDAESHEIWVELEDNLQGDRLRHAEKWDKFKDLLKRVSSHTEFDHRFKIEAHKAFNRSYRDAGTEFTSDEQKRKAAKYFWEEKYDVMAEEVKKSMKEYMDLQEEIAVKGREIQKHLEEETGQAVLTNNQAEWYNMVLDGVSGYYREHLLNLPPNRTRGYYVNWPARLRESYPREFSSYDAAMEAIQHAEDHATQPLHLGEPAETVVSDPNEFTGGHFRNMNNIIHVRADVRDVGDLKALFINEMQSDWHQRGRKHGLNNESAYDRIMFQQVNPLRIKLMGSLQKSIAERMRESSRPDRVRINSSLKAGDIADDFGLYMENQDHISDSEIGDKIRNLNPVAFKDQIKRLQKKRYLGSFSMEDWKGMTMEDFDILQEYLAAYAEAMVHRSDIPNAPMQKTWEQFALKRMVQQAVWENRDYVLWPKTLEQVAQIEGWGQMHTLEDGRHIRLFHDIGDHPTVDAYVKSVDAKIKFYAKKDLLFFSSQYSPDHSYTDYTAIVDRYLVKIGRIAKKQFSKYGVKVEDVDMVQDDWNGLKTEVVQGFKITPELKQAAQAGLPLASQSDTVQGVYHKGQIHIAADAIDTVEEVKGILVHEGGHWLRRNDKEYQTKYNQLVDQFTSLAISPTNTAESLAISQAWALAKRDVETLDNDLVREEALMYFLQDRANQDLSLWKKFVNLIKQWLHRQFGFTPKTLNMSGQEMAEVIVSDLQKYVDEANEVNTEVEEELRENLLYAKKREDIKEHEPKPEADRSPADILLDDIFSTPRTYEEARVLSEKDDLDMAEKISKNATGDVKKVAEVKSRIIQSDFPKGVKAFRREKWEQTSSWLNRVFSSPEYYYTKDTTAKRILDIAIEKNDNKFQWKEDVEGNFITTVTEIQKKNPTAYKKANKYLIEIDQTGEGFFMQGKDDGYQVFDPKGKPIKWVKSEQGAIKFMIEAEQQHLIKRRFSASAREVIKEARLLTNRGFDLTVNDMRRQITAAIDNKAPEPTMVYMDDDGVRNDIALSEAITYMGDLRGTYFPRERQTKEFSLQARGEGLTNQLHTFDAFIPFNKTDFKSKNKIKKLFNANTPLGRKLRELEAQGYTDMTVTPVKNPSGMVFDVPGLLMSMDALLSASDEKLSEAELEAADIKILTAASEQLSLRIADLYKAKGMFSSRMRRSEILWEGYEEDALKALTSYAQRVSTGAAMRETARAMLLAFTGREVTWKQFQEENPDAKYRDYRKMVKKKAINSTTQKELYEDVRTYMSYVLKPDSRTDRIIGYLKAAAVFKFLGMRVSSAAINMTNMVIGVPGTMSAHTGLGIANAWKHVGMSSAKYTLYRLEQLKKTSEVSPAMERKAKRLAKGTVLTDRDRQVFREITRRGWDEAQFNHDAARVLQDTSGKVADWVLSKSMYLFGVTEKANRAMTIHAAFMAHEEAQKKKGKKRSDEFYLKMAQQTSNRAHGIYGKAAKPWLIQQGQVSRLFDLPYTFQKFQHNYMLNMIEIGVKGLQNKNKLAATKNIMYLLLAPGILAGTGASLVAKLSFGLIGSMLGIDEPEEDFYRWIDEKFGEGGTTSRLARHGVTGAMFGINLRGSIQMNNPVPTTLAELGGAPVGVTKDIIDGFIHFSNAEFQKGFEKISPSALGSIIKQQRERDEGVTTKNYAPVYYGNERLRASNLDAALRFFSFNPSRLSAIRERQWKELKVNQAFTKRRSAIKNDITQMIVQESSSPEKWNDIFRDVQEYNERAMGADPRHQVTFISDTWVKNAIKSAFKPDKRERTRYIPEGN